ncbi:MAG: hypothetical protein ABJN36_08140 [Cyclobacteriaceae bacterium]
MKNIVILGLILAINISIKAQNNNEAITAELTELNNSSNLAGCAVAILNKDSIVHEKGFGYANKKTKTPYTIHTIPPIAAMILEDISRIFFKK